jgi:ParB/RepB/Spo0J family partition protein
MRCNRYPVDVRASAEPAKTGIVKRGPAGRPPSSPALELLQESVEHEQLHLLCSERSDAHEPEGRVVFLVPSVREHGVQQPIKLRPKGDRFEIVYGERRLRAAKKVGLAAISATVEKLTDAEAQELRVIENAARENPHPLEEAEAYGQLLAMKDARGDACHTVESLAKL